MLIKIMILKIITIIKKKKKKKFLLKIKKIQFKIEIKILINLFFYYEELKDQLIPQNPEFNPNNKNIIYLISKTWIEKYKSFFNYDKLKSHLIEKQYLSIKKSYNNDENKIEELIEKIESELPKEYIDEINNINNIFELKAYEHKYDIKINKITKPINKELKYLIYGLFISEKYLENFYIEKCNYYYINENNILIKFISEDKKYIDEIVCIGDNNSISLKFLLEYDDDIHNLSNFVKNNFINFYNDNEEYYYEIINENKNIGYCFKIDSIKNLRFEKSIISKQIYDLCKSFIEYEKFIKNPKDIQYNGFLIKKELIETLKKIFFMKNSRKE